MDTKPLKNEEVRHCLVFLQHNHEKIGAPRNVAVLSGLHYRVLVHPLELLEAWFI